MPRHPSILLALTLVLAVAGCSPNSPSPPPFTPPPVPTPTPSPAPQPIVGVQLAGTVSDAVWRPLAGARVEVVAGEGAGLSTVVDNAGQFHLTGPFDETTQVRATADGHLDLTLAFPAFCAPCNPNRWLHFNLESAAPHADLAGHYQMTFVAASECSTLPGEARERTFAAAVTPHSFSSAVGNSQFTMTVSGATVLNNLSHGGLMGIVGDYLSLLLGDHGTGIVEEVAANTYIAIEGVADGSVGHAATEIVLPFIGFIEHCSLSGPMGSFYSCNQPVKQLRCNSTSHRLVLRRLG